jgi:hypothetical protein
MFIHAELVDRPFLPGTCTGTISCARMPFCCACAVPLLAAQRERVLIGTADI